MRGSDSERPSNLAAQLLNFPGDLILPDRGQAKGKELMTHGLPVHVKDRPEAAVITYERLR